MQYTWFIVLVQMFIIVLCYNITTFRELEHTLECEVTVCVANCDDNTTYFLLSAEQNKRLKIKCVVEGSFTLHRATHEQYGSIL